MIHKMTDEKILNLCKIYGERARYYRQKFLGLLPEVYRRGLYKKQGCTSIFEFAAKTAGISEEQVSRVLNLEKKLQDKPDLHSALVNGEIGFNKLRRVAAIATAENQKFLLEQIKILPQRAVEIFVRDERRARETDSNPLRSGVVGRVPILEDKSAFEQGLAEPKLSFEVKQKLCELQSKGININELILSAIKQREVKIEEEKQHLTEEQENQKTSRHIPVKIQQLVQKEHGTKCAVPTCENIAEEIHHTIPFSILKNHNPHFLKPLCKNHHVIAHGVNLAYERMRRLN